MRQRLLLGAIIVKIFCISSPSKAQVDPKIHWQSMRLPHFELLYDAEYQDLANIYAARLEQIYSKLSPLYMQSPERTVVVLNDNTDLTNGFATPLPYSMIQSFPVLPGPNESISEYGDWANELITHEYTHILAMHQKRGAIKGLSYVFGNIMNTNLLLPRWWHEGLAVDMETRFSNFGRLRSKVQESWLRAYLNEDRLSDVTIAEANEVSIPTWPYGARPYLFGSVFWSHAIQEKGIGVVKDISYAQGGRAPYFIEVPAEEYLGFDYNSVFLQTLEEVDSRLRAQMQQIQKVIPTVAKGIHIPDQEAFAPSLSPDGLKMAFIGKDETNRRAIRVMIRPDIHVAFDGKHLKKFADSRLGETGTEKSVPMPHDHLYWPAKQQEDGPPNGTITRISWSPKSDKIIYDKNEIQDRFHEVSDLYEFDIQSTKTERLTHGLRAREPAVSPSGKKIAYVKVSPGKTDIEIYDIDSKTSSKAYEAHLQERCSYPVFMSENEIIFSLRYKGQEVLTRLNLATLKTRTLFSDYPEIHFTHYRNGRLIFTSTKNGVPNLYQASADLLTAKPITHSRTGIFDSEWDSELNEFYIGEQSTRGIKLRRLEASESKRLPQALPMVAGMYADRYAPQPEPDYDTNPDLPVPSEYSVWPYVLPHYWFPFFYWDSYSSYLSASTSGSDPLGKHQWAAAAIYDFVFQRFGYSVGYVNNSWSTQLQAVASDITYNIPGPIPVRNNYDHIEADWELPSISPFLFTDAGWTWLGRSYGGTSTQQLGPQVGGYFANFIQSGAQISPEAGFGASASLTSYLPVGNNLRYNELELSAVKYWSGFLPKRHVLMTKIQSYLVDQIIPLANYNITLSMPTYSNTPYAQYLMRGYQTGAFQGRLMTQGSLEYRFPLKNIYHGSGTTPFFVKRFHGAIVSDGVVLEGYAYDNIYQVYRAVNQTRSFWDAGLELKMDVTLGYEFPLTLYLGGYAALEQSLNNNGNIALGILYQ